MDPKMDQEMEQIVLGCQRKDARAQKRLYDAMAPRMMGLCMRYMRCREDAQDILHEGFIAVFERIGELESAQSLLPWMGRIMINRAINYLTRNNQLVYCDMEQLSSLPEAAEEELDTDRYCLSDVLSAMQRLPDMYRMAFNMHDVESMTYPDMAAALGQTESTLRSLVSRARKMLHDMLATQIANENKN